MASKTTAEKVSAYLDAGMTVLEIAHLLRISPQAVYKHLRRLGREVPSRAAS
jgi:predicted ArsR family transcriptional regulator